MRRLIAVCMLALVLPACSKGANHRAAAAPEATPTPQYVSKQQITEFAQSRLDSRQTLESVRFTSLREWKKHHRGGPPPYFPLDGKIWVATIGGNTAGHEVLFDAQTGAPIGESGYLPGADPY